MCLFQWLHALKVRSQAGRRCRAARPASGLAVSEAKTGPASAVLVEKKSSSDQQFSVGSPEHLIPGLSATRKLCGR